MNEQETKIIKKREVIECGTVLKEVILALVEKGYNPVSQLAGYLLSGEPLYITNFNGARNLIQNVDRTELMEYIANKLVKEVVDEQNNSNK